MLQDYLNITPRIREFIRLSWNIIRHLTWSTTIIAFILFMLGLSAVINGSIPYPSFFPYWLIVLHNEIGSELIGVAITVFFIDTINHLRNIQEYKRRLIREMRSQDPGITERAVEELRQYGWLEDGSLRGARLNKANLKGLDLHFANLQNASLIEASMERANLKDANLQEADLCEVNLKGATLQGANLKAANMRNTILIGANLERANLAGASPSEIQLVNANKLRGSMVFLGNSYRKYDGRYALRGDIEKAINEGIEPKNIKEMTDYYEITIEEFTKAKQWYQENKSWLEEVQQSRHFGFP